MPGCVVFDLDGTLVDSAPDMCATVNRMLRASGLPGIDVSQARSFIGDGIAMFVERAWRAAGPGLSGAERDATVSAFIAAYEHAPAVLTRPYPGVTETLTELERRGFVLAVCTNKLQAISERILADLAFPVRFRSIVGGDRATERKPAPGHLLQVLAEAGAIPGETVMVGDSAHDTEMARRAGVRSVLVTYGYARRDPATIEADHRIERFPDLLGLVTTP